MDCKGLFARVDDDGGGAKSLAGPKLTKILLEGFWKRGGKQI